MKRFAILSAVLALVVAGGLAVYASAQSDHPMFHHHRRGFRHMARELNLTDAQKTQVKAIFQAERPAMSPLVHELAAERKEMDQATASGHLDESKVQAIAARQGATIAKLIVEKQNVRSKIYNTVLTPEQRTKADALQARMHAHLDRFADHTGSTSGGM